MPKIPVLTDKEMISLLEDNGFIFSRQARILKDAGISFS